MRGFKPYKFKREMPLTRRVDGIIKLNINQPLLPIFPDKKLRDLMNNYFGLHVGDTIIVRNAMTNNQSWQEAIIARSSDYFDPKRYSNGLLVHIELAPQLSLPSNPLEYINKRGMYRIQMAHPDLIFR